MTVSKKLPLAIVAITIVALGLIWSSRTGVAEQGSMALAEARYNQLQDNLYSDNNAIYADTAEINATEQPGSEVAVPEDSRETLFKNIKLFNTMAYYIKNRYMEDVDAKELVRAGIRGMLQNLDPFSVLMEQKSYDRLMESTHGKYEGLGMQIDSRDDHIVIVSPIEGTPAYRKGLRAGDVIMKIEGQSTYKMSTQDAANLMRGEAGTSVNLTIKREGVADLLDYDVERAVIELKSVNYYGYIGDSNIGYIRLSRFAEETGNELREALTDLQNERELDGLIFDLRSNGGGLLTQAVETASLFLDEDRLVVYTRGKEADSERRYYSRRPPLMPDGKLVILVDEGTASASEIVSGAIQDWDRGIIIGQNTYGKGLVQQIFPAGGDAGIALKLTTAKYYIPSGRCIQRPDHSKKNPHPFIAEEDEGEDTEEADGEEAAMDTTAVDSTSGKKEIFFTNNGRPVYGGGGIVPDIEMEREKWQPIEINLERQSMFFDFAVKYYAAHPDIDRTFEVTDEILNEFKAFLKERDFDYKTALEISLEEMEDVVAEENKADLFDESLKKLDQLVEKEKEMDFDRSQDYIKRSIKRELMTKLYGQRGLYEEIILKTDPTVKRALEVISNDKEYTGIIEGTGVSKKAEL